jgi:YibE/F-like protein
MAGIAARWQGSSGPLGGRQLVVLVASRGGRLLVGAVAGIAVMTVIGLVALWPRGVDSGSADAGVGTIPATVLRVLDRPCAVGAVEVCRSLVVSVEGREVTLGLNLARLAPSVEPGDQVRVMRPGRADTAPSPDQSVPYEFAEVDRRGSLLWIVVVVAVLAAVLLRWRGVFAVLGAGLSLAVLVLFLVPAILAGRPALLVALVASLAVMFVTLILTNGLGAQTLAAALGVSATLGVTCLVGARRAVCEPWHHFRVQPAIDRGA